MALGLAFVFSAIAAESISTVLVLDQGGSHASLLAGEPLQPEHAWALRGAPVREPLFSPDGQRIYFFFADGWVTQFDRQQRRVSAEVHAAGDFTAAALSSDGQWLAVATGQPPRLEIYDRELKLVKSHAAATLNRQPAQRIDVLADAPQRRSFVASLSGIPELWELSYNPDADPIHDGLVHDFRMAEAIARPGFLGVRRTPLQVSMSAFAIDASGRHVLAVARTESATAAGAAIGLQAEVINLDIRRRIAGVVLAARPDPVMSGLGMAYPSAQGPRLAWLCPSPPTLEVVDAATWHRIGSRRLSGRALALQNPDGGSSLWVGLASEGREMPGQFRAILLVDKETLDEVARFAEPGRVLGRWAVARDGATAWVPVVGEGGELLEIDGRTLQVVRRMPMDRPLSAFAVPALLKR